MSEESPRIDAAWGLRDESLVYQELVATDSWDWGRVEDEAARFENMVAAHLVRLAHYLQDWHGEPAEGGK